MQGPWRIQPGLTGHHPLQRNKNVETVPDIVHLVNNVPYHTLERRAPEVGWNGAVLHREIRAMGLQAATFRSTVLSVRVDSVVGKHPSRASYARASGEESGRLGWNFVY